MFVYTMISVLYDVYVQAAGNAAAAVVVTGTVCRHCVASGRKGSKLPRPPIAEVTVNVDSRTRLTTGRCVRVRVCELCTRWCGL